MAAGGGVAGGDECRSTIPLSSDFLIFWTTCPSHRHNYRPFSSYFSEVSPGAFWQKSCSCSSEIFAANSRAPIFLVSRDSHVNCQAWKSPTQLCLVSRGWFFFFLKGPAVTARIAGCPFLSKQEISLCLKKKRIPLLSTNAIIRQLIFPVNIEVGAAQSSYSSPALFLASEPSASRISGRPGWPARLKNPSTDFWEAVASQLGKATMHENKQTNCKITFKGRDGTHLHFSRSKN